MTAPIAAYVTNARQALETLADRLRRGDDAALEVADACSALRALADAWALVVPRLDAYTTPPEWPTVPMLPHWSKVDPRRMIEMLQRTSGVFTLVDATNFYAGALDAYAAALDAWGREAAACEEEASESATEVPS